MMRDHIKSRGQWYETGVNNSLLFTLILGLGSRKDANAGLMIGQDRLLCILRELDNFDVVIGLCDLILDAVDLADDQIDS